MTIEECFHKFTKAQKQFLISKANQWWFEGERPGIEKTLTKLGLVRIYRSRGYLCLTDAGEQLAANLKTIANEAIDK